MWICLIYYVIGRKNPSHTLVPLCLCALACEWIKFFFLSILAFVVVIMIVVVSHLLNMLFNFTIHWFCLNYIPSKEVVRKITVMRHAFNGEICDFIVNLKSEIHWSWFIKVCTLVAEWEEDTYFLFAFVTKNVKCIELNRLNKYEVIFICNNVVDQCT